MKNDYSHILKCINNTNKEYILGIDEAGYGALAGHIYVCAFIAPKNWNLKGLNDSKQLTEKNRENIYNHLYDNQNNKVWFSIVSVHPNNMNEYKEYGNNVHSALKFLYWNAAANAIKISGLDPLIVLDGIIKFPKIPYQLGVSVSLPKADALIPAVMAASVIAKVSRDNQMKYFHKKYPVYDWENNKGYGTKSHLDGINKFGICEEHRVHYKPIKSILKNAKL